MVRAFWSRLGLLAGGLALLALGVVGVMHGLRAGRAQALYFKSKYGAWQHDLERILAAAQQAHALYPHNDELCIWTAETAYARREDAAGVEQPERVAAAARWCAEGLRLNPYASELRRLDVTLTERHSLPEAIRKWEAFVDWQYWEPYNHAVLVDLYARAGRYDDAQAALRLIRGHPFEAQARSALADAWKAEIESMQRFSGRH